MISLVFEGKCEGCNQADLEVDEIELLDGSARYLVRCNHEGACERMRSIRDRRASSDESGSD